MTFRDTNYTVALDGTVINSKTNKEIKPRIMYNGYMRVKVKGKEMFVHRLIAEMYIPNPNNYPIINHIDGNKLNNSVENLEWCTYSHNNKHACNSGLNKGNLKISNDDASEIIEAYYAGVGLTYKEIGKHYNVNPRTIGRIINKKIA